MNILTTNFDEGAHMYSSINTLGIDPSTNGFVMKPHSRIILKIFMDNKYTIDTIVLSDKNTNEKIKHSYQRLPFDGDNEFYSIEFNSSDNDLDLKINTKEK